MAQTVIELTDDQVAALEVLANDRNMTLTDLIQESINNLIHTTSMPKSDALKQRAIAFAGKFRSGKPDLAQNHDQYFMETLEL